MNLKLKERVFIQFLVKEDSISKEIHNRLRNVYGGAVIDINNVLYCVKKSANGETEVTDKDKLRSDRQQQLSEMQIENVLMHCFEDIDALQ